MCREEVARNQRARLYGATIEAVSKHGYRATSVADITGLAGVSRRAFYEQFANKQACFLATYDVIVARERKRVIDAWQRERSWSSRLHAAVKTILDGAAANPKAARLVLIDALAIRPAAGDRIQATAATFARLIATAYQLAPDRRLAPLAPEAIVGGIRHIMLKHLLEHREQQLHGLTDEILDWVQSYHSPRAPQAAAQCLTPPADSLPPPSQHARTCKPILLESVLAEALDAGRNRADSTSSWPETVQAATAGVAAWLARHPTLMRDAIREPLKDAQTVARALNSVEQLACLLTEQGPGTSRGPAVAREAVTGALWATIATHARRERLAQLPRAVDHLAFTVLAPYLGAGGAREAMRGAGFAHAA
jgi:AcrR family transcriptional regulator